MSQFPLYSSRGEWKGMLVDHLIYNPQGEWIGWVDQERRVFSVAGEYVGWLNKDFRVLRRRVIERPVPRRSPPARPPERRRMPANVPLAPLMAELTFDTIDVFEDAPELLSPLDLDHMPDID
jgi:4-fold beta-flower domain-containing protein